MLLFFTNKMVMTRHLVAALAAWSTASVASPTPFASPLASSYVVQLHTTRNDFIPPQDGALPRMQLMTTESGQTFECYLPPVSRSGPESNALDDKKDEEKQEIVDFLTFGREAAQKISHQCIQHEDKTTASLYEICVGSSLRRQGLEHKEVEIESTGATTNAERVGGQTVDKVATFVKDSSRPALTYDEFVMPEIQDQVKNSDKPLFTQTFGEGKDQILVQFICSTTTQDDKVFGVQWRHDASIDGPRDIAAFLIGSQVFCNPQDLDTDGNVSFTVRSLLQPLKDGDTCVTKNDGWWTYQFCFGRSLRQYHRDKDSRIVNDFSLGTFDVEGNRELEDSGSVLVSEPIDDTHDVSRAAYLELYDDGTACDSVENHAVRKAKVFYFCSQGGTSHHVLSVKETQTCTYTVKVSTPVLCDHPHFLKDEKTSDPTSEIVHCIPVADA